jgi:excisionase family DNA binding protein
MESVIMNELKELKGEISQLKSITLLGSKQALSLGEAALITSLSRSHLYKMCHQRKVPYWKSSGGKHTFFDRDELTAWMLHRRIKTSDELETEATNYIVNGKTKPVVPRIDVSTKVKAGTKGGQRYE